MDSARSSLLLDVEDLAVRYARSQPPAIDQIDLQLAPGERCIVTGPSGCGKTTLARAIARLLPATALVTSRRFHWRDHDLSSLNERAMHRFRGSQIGFVSQTPELALSPFSRVGTQLDTVLQSRPSQSRQNMTRSERRAHLEALFAHLNLPLAFLRRFPHELSGGERQRVVIAQAAALQPALLIADEPTSALDPIAAARLLGLLKKIGDQTGAAVLLITHDWRVASRWADRLVTMDSGRLQRPVAA